MRMTHGCAVAALLGAPACGRHQSESGQVARADAQKKDVPTIADANAWSVSIAVKPGKPGAPTECIAVRFASGKAALDVERLGDDQKVLAQGTCELADKDFGKVKALLEELRLEEFVPRVASGQVFDFGVQRLRIEIGAQNAETPHVQEVEWETPLENESDIAPFIQTLTKLAQEHVKNVKLAYLRAP